MLIVHVVLLSKPPTPVVIRITESLDSCHLFLEMVDMSLLRVLFNLSKLGFDEIRVHCSIFAQNN